MQWTDEQREVLDGNPKHIGMVEKHHMWFYDEPAGLLIYNWDSPGGFIPLATIRAYLRRHDKARRAR